MGSLCICGQNCCEPKAALKKIKAIKKNGWVYCQPESLVIVEAGHKTEDLSV